MPEATRTKKALAGAMKELMSARPFSEITVTDICARCGLTRKALYYHFNDKYELVNWVFHSEFILPLQGRTHTDFWALIREVADYLYANRQFYSNAFRIQGDDGFWFFFARYLQPHLLATMHNHFDDSFFYTVEEKRDAWAEFLADAWVYALKKWILYYPQQTPGQFVDLFEVHSWVENPPEYYEKKD